MIDVLTLLRELCAQFVLDSLMEMGGGGTAIDKVNKFESKIESLRKMYNVKLTKRSPSFPHPSSLYFRFAVLVF